MIENTSTLQHALHKLGVPPDFMFPMEVTTSLIIVCVGIAILVKLFDWVVYNYYL